MVERLRGLLEHPLDPTVARAVLVLAFAASVGFAAVALLADVGDRPSVVARTNRDLRPARALDERTRPAPPVSSAAVAGQDRQDRPGTVVHRRAIHEVTAHRALQHVPYRAGGLSIELAGARRGRALLTVKAPTIGAARRGWRRFLRRFGDVGSAYLPRFESGRHRG